MRQAHRWVSLAVTSLIVAVSQLSVAEEVASPKLQKVTVRDGVELHYVELGEGIPIVFIHGGLGDYSTWNNQLGAFAKDYRVIAYSRRYNYPNKNKIRPGHSAAVEAEDLAAFIREKGLEKVHVVGHSYGAYTGLLLAIGHPELVRTVTLAEPPVMCWLDDLPGARRKQGKDLRADSMNRCWKPAKTAFANEDVDGALRIIVDFILGKGTYDTLPSAARKRVLLNGRELEALVASGELYPPVDRDSVCKLNVPTMLMYGEKSHLAAQLVGEELRRLVPDKVQMWMPVPGATHAMWQQKPKECREAVLQFLVGK